METLLQVLGMSTKMVTSVCHLIILKHDFKIIHCIVLHPQALPPSHLLCDVSRLKSYCLALNY